LPHSAETGVETPGKGGINKRFMPATIEFIRR